MVLKNKIWKHVFHITIGNTAILTPLASHQHLDYFLIQKATKETIAFMLHSFWYLFQLLQNTRSNVNNTEWNPRLFGLSHHTKHRLTHISRFHCHTFSTLHTKHTHSHSSQLFKYRKKRIPFRETHSCALMGFKLTVLAANFSVERQSMSAPIEILWRRNRQATPRQRVCFLWECGLALRTSRIHLFRSVR